jgi:hypothetical protein
MKRIVSLSAVLVVAALAGCDKKGGPLKIDRIEPAEGVSAGGDHVTVHGSGFEPGKTQVEVLFGRRKAEQVSISAIGKITVVTPPGDKGPIDVTFLFNDGTAMKLASGFRYVSTAGTEDVRKAYFGGQGTDQPAQK